MLGAGPPTTPRRAATLAAAVVLAATGCGTLSAAEQDVATRPGTVTRAPSGLTPGPYALTTAEGAVISFDLPTVPAPDHEVESLRRDLDVEAVTYVELHIDNTEGTRAVEIDDLKVISHEGGQFPFQPAAEVLADWDPDRSLEGGYWDADGTPLDPRAGAALDARVHALIAHYTGPVPAGAQGHELMIGDFEHLPASFDDVELSPYPHERALVPAPVGHGPHQRQYRAERPVPVPRDRVERVRVPAPEPPAGPAEPVSRPAAEPTTDPRPAQVAGCGDPAPPAGTEACAPAQADRPAPAEVDEPGPAPAEADRPAPAPAEADRPAPAPAPTTAPAPTGEPTAVPSPGPTGGDTIGTAGESPQAPEGQEGRGPVAVPPSSAGTAERRPRPTRPPGAPGPGPSPDPAAQAPAGSGQGSPEPPSSLPRAGEAS